MDLDAISLSGSDENDDMGDDVAAAAGPDAGAASASEAESDDDSSSDVDLEEIVFSSTNWESADGVRFLPI